MKNLRFLGLLLATLVLAGCFEDPNASPERQEIANPKIELYEGARSNNQPYIYPTTAFVFSRELGAWCAHFGQYTSAGWGGCVPEYQIPPARLRELRLKANLDPNAPVFNPAAPAR